MSRLACALVVVAVMGASLAAAQNPPLTPPSGRCAWAHLANDVCPTDRGCLFDADIKLCYDPKCRDIRNATGCNDRDGCVWNGTACKDYNVQFSIPRNFWCAAVKNNGLCDSISSCRWVAAVRVCAAGNAGPGGNQNPKCNGTVAAGTCPLGAGCVFRQNRCFFPRCRLQRNATTCLSSNESCAWNETEKICVDRWFADRPDNCSEWTHPAPCIATRKCGWARDKCVPGLNTNGVRLGGCAFVANRSNCRAENGCVYDEQLAKCFDPNCARNTEQRVCVNVSGCAWSRNECLDQSLVFGSHACSSLTSADLCRGKCGWSVPNQTCVALAGTCSFNTAATCPAGCDKIDGTDVCASSACPASLGGGNPCDRSLGCVVANGKCFDYNIAFGKFPCDKVKKEALCGGACQWNNNTCIPGGEGTPCSQLRQGEKRFCPERCGYDEGLKMCYERRCPGLAKTDCLAQKSYGCAWRNSMCGDQNVMFGFYECRLAPTPQLCGGRCAWTNNQCAVNQPCAFGVQGDPFQCPRPRCSYEPQVNFCVDPSCPAQTTKDACADKAGCVWRDNGCFDFNIAMKAFDCGRVQNVSFCGGRCRVDNTTNPPRCAFDPKRVPCSELRQGDPRECDMTRCTFDEGSKMCYDRACSNITAASDCGNRPGCAWKDLACYDRNVLYKRYPCDGVQRAEACQGQCVWNDNITDAARKCQQKNWLPTGCTQTMVETEVSQLRTCLDRVRAVERLGVNVNLTFLRTEVAAVCENSDCARALSATKCATQFLRWGKTLCVKKNATDPREDYCGVSVLAQQMAKCGDIAPTDPSNPSSAEAACNATAACKFNTKANRCEFRPTQDLLRLQCSPCVRTFKDVENLVDQRRGVQLEKPDALQGFDVVCAKVRGNYCLGRFSIEQFADFKPRDMGPDQLMRLCSNETNSTDRRCFQKVAGAVMKRRVAAAESAMLECSRTAGLTGGRDCSSEYQQLLQQAREYDAMVASMCTRAPDGRFCVTLPKILGNTSAGTQACFQSVVQRGEQCSAQCDGLLQTEVASWGCCVGTLQRIFGDANVKDRVARMLTVAQKQAPPATDAESTAGGSTSLEAASRRLLQATQPPPPAPAGGPALPTTTRAGGSAPPQGSTTLPPQGPGTLAPSGGQGPSGAPVQGGGGNGTSAGGSNQQQQQPQPMQPKNDRLTGFLDNLRQCSSFTSGITTLLQNTCNVSFAPAMVKRKLFLTISWDALQSDSSLSSAVQDALQEDFQGMMGLSSDKMPNFTMGEAPQVTVTTTNTTARGMRVLKSGSGTYVEATVQDESADANADATYDYDASVSDESVSTSSTSDVLDSQCSDSTSCVDSSSTSLVSYSATQSSIPTTTAAVVNEAGLGSATTTTTAPKTSGAAPVATLAAAVIAALLIAVLA